MKGIPFKTAVYIMIVLLTLVLVFHLLVFVEVIPFTIVWAGRMQSVNEMRVFESVSILLNTILLLAVLAKAHYLKLPVNKRIVHIVLIVFVVIFALNTIGNVFAKAAFERWVFTPLTFISAVLCYRIAAE